MSDFDLTLTPEAAEEYKKSADLNLQAPTKEENSTFNGGKEAGLGSWTEVVKIRDTDILPTKNDPSNANKANFFFLLEVMGASEGGFTTNAGRSHYQNFFIDKVGLASPDGRTSGPYKRRIATINSLFNALGVDIREVVGSYKKWFKGDKPLVGQTVAAVVRRYKDKEGTVRVDVDAFAPIQ